MVNRVGLIEAVASSVKMNARDGVGYQKALNKALITLLANYDLDAARALPKALKAELATAIDQLFTLPELKKISKKWEPKRSVASGFTQTEIVKALISLLDGAREPYVRPKLELDAAMNLKRDDKAALIEQIKNLMPKPELKAVLKLWDKKFKPPASWTPKQFKERLLGLLSGDVVPE